MKKVLLLLTLSSLTFVVTATAVTYTENFDNIQSGWPNYPPGWGGSTGATASSVGLFQPFNQATVAWSSTTGQFANYASATGNTGSEPTATQAADTNRSLGIRPTAAFGDVGAAFNFNFSTSGVTVSAISIDLMMLSVQTRSTTYTIQYGIGNSPSSFTTLGTYPDPGVFGTTTFSFTTTDFGTNLDNQSSVWFRIVSLAASTGSGSRDTVGIDNFSLTSSGAISTLLLVPEPATYMLLGLGALVCAQQFRRSTA
ncbi:MAG: PEP-CTERM sorting domain-containing protein [Chthoniobacterales bacterium]